MAEDTDRYDAQLTTQRDLGGFPPQLTTQRAIDNYETQKLSKLRHDYERELQLQLEREAFRAEKLQEQEAIVRDREICRDIVDERQLEKAVRLMALEDNIGGTVSRRFELQRRNAGKPPIPIRRAHSAKTLREVERVENCNNPYLLKENLRITRPSSALPLKPWHIHHLKQQHRDSQKRVGFNLPKSYSAYPDVKKPLIPKNGASHFFEWRNMSTKYAPTPDLYKQTKLQQYQSRVDTQGRLGSANNDGAVQVNVKCPEDEQLNVTLNVNRAPSRLY